MSVARPSVDLPHFAFATGIVVWSAWFCWDAWRTSVDVENMILIVPIAVVAVILYLFVAVSCFRVSSTTRREPLAAGMGIRIACSMALLAAFVVAGPLIGFDVACFLYLLAMMVFLGERRILVLLLAPLLFCVAAIYCFSELLSTPLPLLFSRGEG
jgi:hypothetical protein